MTVAAHPSKQIIASGGCETDQTIRLWQLAPDIQETPQDASQTSLSV